MLEKNINIELESNDVNEIYVWDQHRSPLHCSA